MADKRNANEAESSQDGLTYKCATISDFMNSKCLPVDVDLPFEIDNTELVFDKPIFDIAIIMTHPSLILKCSGFESHFHTEFAFTTHSIYLPDMSKLKLCIRDLKLHNVSYAVVLNEESLQKDIMDLYILYPLIEVQLQMQLLEVTDLIRADYNNFTIQVSTMKAKSDKNPHPQDSNHLRLTEQMRYYLCLLGDNRMLSRPELTEILDYLNFRKNHLTTIMKKNINYFEERPLQSCRQERLKYYIYEPHVAALAPAIGEYRPTEPVVAAKNSDATRPAVKFSVASHKKSNPFNLIQPNVGISNYDNKALLCKPTIIQSDFSVNLQQIKSVQLKRATCKQLIYNISKGAIQTEFAKRNDASEVPYNQSEYYFRTREPDVVSVSSGSCSPILDYALSPISPPSTKSSPLKLEGKRKSDEINNIIEQPLPKHFAMDVPKDVNIFSPQIKNSPDNLLNLLRLILNIVPLDLPHDNAILNILVHHSNDIQSKIFEPSLKNVKIDYESCKTTGLYEMIKSIYGVYEVSEKQVDDIADMSYVWTKYFPDHLSNFNLLIVFYRVIKMLIIFRLFNSQADRLGIVMDVIEKINIIVDFDFKLLIISDKDQHLNCLPDLFNGNYLKRKELHTMFFELPHLSTIGTADGRKNLDVVIKRKKIEYTIGPLLNYFVSCVNSLHQQMKTNQTEDIYDGIRTLRFCLRQIYPVNSPSTIFNAPKVFTEPNTNTRELYEELKWLLDEIRYYHSVLFTEKHYEFINCLLDFSCLIDNTLTTDSDTYTPKTNMDSIITIDPKQFIENFASQESMVLQYHPETELFYLRNFLRDNWTHFLEKAFRGITVEGKGKRIIKELNNFLPTMWGVRTFDESVGEAAKLNYNYWSRIAQSDRKGWMDAFNQVKYAGVIWLNTNQLPFSKAVEELQKYENMLKNEFLN